jgi:hypothetical protein
MVDPGCALLSRHAINGCWNVAGLLIRRSPELCACKPLLCMPWPNDGAACVMKSLRQQWRWMHVWPTRRR